MKNNADFPARLEWKRFWCPRDGTFNLTDDGFLHKDLKHDFASRDARLLADLADVPCLVLLGSPGMGKTDELTAAHHRDQGAKLFVDLGRLIDARSLREELSENPTIKKWATDSAAPTLWLDSLDEGIGDISNLAGILQDELVRLTHDLPQLRVRISCRIANWPASLERALKEIWPGDACKVYELLPLRVEDAKQAAARHDVSFDQFLEAVRSAKAGPLAAKPVTLQRMLLPEFKESGRLPSRQVDVYEIGCKRLAAEWAIGRQERSVSTNHDAESLFVAAQSVAAAMTFFGRAALDCTPGRDTGASDAVHSREIGSTADKSAELFLAPSIASVEAVAKTALMSAATQQYFYRFEHRTFQEFLAAHFLYSQQMPLPKVLGLFLNPNSPDNRVVPQLIETAAWLAAMDPKFRDALLEADPVAVLHSDVASQEDATQRRLFSALCDGLRNGEISDAEWRRDDLHGLRFFGIADEIHAILNNTAEAEQVREFAIDVAWHAPVIAVYDRLADLALNTTRPLREREHCTYALARREDESGYVRNVTARLAPLLDTTPKEDPNDTLRGNSLIALWRNLDPRRLFAVLRPHHNPNYTGAYWVALETIRRELGPQHVLAGLDWAEKQPQAQAIDRDLRRIMSRVFNLSWQNLDNPDILDAFARAAAVRLRFSEDVRLDDDGNEDHDPYARGHTDQPHELPRDNTVDAARRHKLCQAMVRTVAGEESAAFWLSYYLPLVRPEDFEWLLEQFVADGTEAERKVWLDLALRAWQGSSEQVSVVTRLGANQLPIQEAFRKRIALLDPESPESRAGRQEWERQEKELREITARNTPEPLDPPIAQRIEALLKEVEHGKLAAWAQVWHLMRFDDYGQHTGSLDFGQDIRGTYYWQNAPQKAREGVILAAEKYVLEARESPDQWIGQNVVHPPSYAGLAALMLLYHERREFFDSLPPDAWTRWPCIVLDFPNAESKGVWADLLSAAYKKAPDAFRQAVQRLLRAQVQNPVAADVLWRLQSLWDEPLSATVFGLVSVEPSTQAVLTQALDLLLERDYKPARAWCLALINAAAPFGQTSEIHLEAAAAALLRNRPTSDEWATLWELMARPERLEFTLRVLGEDRDLRHMDCGGLSEVQLGDLYLWLRHNAPPVPEHRGVYSPGQAEFLDDLKRSVLNSLMQRGTRAAVEQCERIYVELKDPWFIRVITAAKAETRRTGWVPVRPQDLWLYVSKAKRLIARGEHELSEAVLEALDRINKRLQGENPSAEDLWDGTQPKDERRLSLWLQRQLQSELIQVGVFIGREIAVKVRGQTDIQVVAKPIADEPEFGVIIEVKGCWHKEVETAMETQLRDRYLMKHSFTHGIYVVGWFYCKVWKDKKPTHNKAYRGQTRDEAQRSFEKQAEQLSSDAMTIRAFVLDATLRG